MTDAAADSGASNSRDWRGHFAVLLLSVTAVLTAWCGFQSSKWGGEMSIAFSSASSARIQSTENASEARDLKAFDLAIYSQWVVAKAHGDERLAGYIEERFAEPFASAFTAWQEAGKTEPSPFKHPAYELEAAAESRELAERADTQFAAALENNARGDRYSLLTVLFALVLFLTAMSQRDISVWGSRFLVGMAFAVAVVGATIMLTFPVKL